MSMDLEHLEGILRTGETLAVEFKSDQRREFTDKEIYEEIVALANTDGGTLLIGVEDDGTVTGSRDRHELTTEPRKHHVSDIQQYGPERQYARVGRRPPERQGHRRRGRLLP